MEAIEIHKMLLEPIDYKFRIQSIGFGKATVVAYIDARQLQDRLDEVVGFQNWQVAYKEIKGNLFAGIAIKIEDEWVWKYDCGTESNVEKEKGEASDSFKRAGVMWGVGRFLYSLPILILNTKEHITKGGKKKDYPVNDKGEILWTTDDLNSYCKILSKRGSKGVESKSLKSVEDAIAEMRNANNVNQLTAIFNANQHLQQVKQFLDALTARKEEIKLKVA